MAVQRLTIKQATVLRNPGKQSVQIVSPENAPDAAVTITRVTMEPGAISPRHSHARSEQIWIVEEGSTTLLLADGRSEELADWRRYSNTAQRHSWRREHRTGATRLFDGHVSS